MLWATDEVPARFFAADLNDGKVVPNITDDEASAVGISEGAKAEMTEEFNAHERTVGAGEINVVEDHGVVPVLAVTAPSVAGSIGFHVPGPHEVGRVDVVGRDVGVVVAAAGGPGGMVGFKVPVGGAVHVFLKGPRTARAASGLVFCGVPVVGVDGVVGGVGFIHDLQLNIQVGGLTVEGVHAGVGYGHVDGSCAFTHHAEEAVGW